jgi:hypothetical protein
MSTSAENTATTTEAKPVGKVLAVLAWLWVLVPFGYGLVQLLGRIPALFS